MAQLMIFYTIRECDGKASMACGLTFMSIAEAARYARDELHMKSFEIYYGARRVMGEYGG